MRPRIINLSMLIQLLTLTFFLLTVACESCQSQIAQLARLSVLDKAKFAKEVHGYVLYSGKMIDDLGLPQSCNKFPSYSYFTGEAKGVKDDIQYRLYLGVCFSSNCNPQDIEDNFGFISKTVLNISNTANVTMAFREPLLEIQSTAGEIIIILFFVGLIGVSLKEVVFNFFVNCKKEASKEDQQLYGKYAIQFGEDYDPTLLVIQQHETVFKKMCLKSKMHEYFTAQESYKIISFSAFRILAVPLALYGYLFYLTNVASYNYSAFDDEIYNQNYAKLALTAYYIPDVLFFISGFLIAKKGFELIELETRGTSALLKLFLSKVTKLIPLYWAVIAIYWQVTPALHAGPVWYEYQGEAAVCNGAWWRVLLFIDNWFENGCYDFGWYIPAQIQLTFICCFILWVYINNKKAGFVVLIALTAITWILTLVLSAPFPSSLETTLNADSLKYFKSTYSHMPFYLFGVINGYLASNQKAKETMFNLTKNTTFRVIGIVLGTFLMVLVLLRPSVWQGELGFQLGLSKTGVVLGAYFLMFWSMFGAQMRTTVIHRIATLSKGALLVGGLVVSSYFWASYTLPYVDRLYLFSITISNILIAVPVGSLIIALVYPRPRKEEQIIL